MAADSALLLSLVEEYVSGLQDSKAKDTGTAVKNGEFTVLQLVEALGLSLTSSQPHTRARGVQLLSEVLHECYGGLTEKEVEVLLVFYENRLKDHHVITPPVLQGLRALTKCTVLPPGSAVSMLRSLFQDVHVQSLMLTERAYVYNMLINLMAIREAELKGLGPDFVFGFVQSMDGERDPRNLLLAFQIAKGIVLRGYDLGKFTEELFEVTSCYFPIDFSPPPNDPHGITREELILTLRDVLAGTPRFAEFLLPLIIEKLDSDVQSAKLDSLQTLTACVSQYEHKDLAEFLEGLWASLRREVFQTSSEKIESAGLAAVTAITSCLSRSVLNSDSEDSLSTFLELVLKDCTHHLCEPDLKLVWPSAKLLQAACSASFRASCVITAATMPSLIEQYTNRAQCSQRRTLLEVVQKFIQSVKTCQTSESEDSVFVAFRPSLCSMVFSALTETNSSLQVTACSVLTSLAQQPGLLLDSDIELAVDHLTRLLLTEQDHTVSVAVVECAGALAELHPAAFISNFIPRLKTEMFSEPIDQDNNRAESEQLSHHAVRQRCLSALAAVSIKPSVVQESTPVLLQVLSAAHTGGFSVEEVVLACRSLQRIAEQVPDSEETGRCFHDVIIPRLLSLALQAALQGEDGNRSPLLEEAVLSSMVPIISTSCSRLQPTLALQTASRAVSLFLDGDVSFLPDNSFPSNIQLLKQHSWTQTQMVCLLVGCVCSLPRSVEVPRVDELLSALEEMSCSALHPLSYTSAAKCLSGLLNKKPHGDSLDSRIHSTMKRVCRELDSSSSSVHTQAFTLMIWVEKKPNFLKALSNIVNKLPKQVQLTELPALLSLLLEALSCPDLGVQLSTLSCLQPVLVDPPPSLIQQLEALIGRLLALTGSPDMEVRISSLRCIHAVSQFPEHEILPVRARVLRALARPLDDRKRLVRREAVHARNDWFLVGS
ncbi:hypothetical protein CesoFtcFv8_021725 [Champsocephalus esox]|uniref:MMS19 nucleotide excision repair protein n=1 Tax=Champsocephalus esox TaxID=159716 RepID=A0AAN8B9U4_9TELE|nr:hypothetical protein CesoFtcFv8_021725 [Champsocephalus esox]